MSEGQIVAVVWGPIAVVFGVCFIAFRHRIARAASRHRPHQTPTLMAAGGAVFLIVGLAVTVAGVTGHIDRI